IIHAHEFSQGKRIQMSGSSRFIENKRLLHAPATLNTAASIATPTCCKGLGRALHTVNRNGGLISSERK
ncbi:hypothetical protein STEG23_015860, partial [Scotinomys teguina]